MKNKMYRIAALLLASVLLLALCSSCAENEEADHRLSAPEQSVGSVQPVSPLPPERDVYSELFTRLKENREASRMEGLWPTEEPKGIPDAEPEPTEEMKSAAADYSVTNVQVEGIDEGDIVKTDGEYIYRLSGAELLICRAAGAETELVSRTKLNADEDDLWTRELYICGKTLCVVASVVLWEDPAFPREVTQLFFYDISAAEAPALVEKMRVDGYFNAARMKDSTLYLVTGYVPEAELYPDKLHSYIPAVYEADAPVVFEPECLCLSEHGGASYVVITTFDLPSAELVDKLAVLGRGGEVYMSEDNIYVLAYDYEQSVSEPYTVDNYTVRDHREGSVTRIMKFALSGQDVELAAEGSVRGAPVNRYAVDERDGYLRVVSTFYGNEYRSFEDEVHGWTNIEGYLDHRSTSLVILDGELNPVSAIENIAPEERVYSVRYDGDIAYFVTFRNVDPLFCADLSDPENPVLLSELKLPGFSQYMHVYGQDRLLGIGMDANEQTGNTGTMKLSMFDTSVKTAVSVKHSLVIEQWYSDVLYDARAALINPDKDIIAFPADSGYVVYGYSDESGFYSRAQIDLYYEYGARGLFIGDHLYVSSESQLIVFSLEDFSRLAEISFQAAES